MSPVEGRYGECDNITKVTDKILNINGPNTDPYGAPDRPSKCYGITQHNEHDTVCWLGNHNQQS
jgi:hypothetical protein